MKIPLRQYFVLTVKEGVTPVLSKPFDNIEARGQNAREIHDKTGPDDGVFWLDVVKGYVSTGTYSASFFEKRG